jgi:hypothetical protein
MSNLTPHIYLFNTSQKLTDLQIELINFLLQDHLHTHDEIKEEDIPEFTTELQYHLTQ